MAATEAQIREKTERDLARANMLWLVLMGATLQSRERLEAVTGDARLETTPYPMQLRAIKDGREAVAKLLGVSGEGPILDLVVEEIARQNQARAAVHRAAEIQSAWAMGDHAQVIEAARRIAEVVA